MPTPRWVRHSIHGQVRRVLGVAEGAMEIQGIKNRSISYLAGEAGCQVPRTKGDRGRADRARRRYVAKQIRGPEQTSRRSRDAAEIVEGRALTGQ